jgi:hypothetical protein
MSISAPNKIWVFVVVFPMQRFVHDFFSNDLFSFFCFNQDQNQSLFQSMGVWEGVAMDSLKYHSSTSCLTLLHCVGRTPLKWPYCRFRGSPPIGWSACTLLLPLWTPHAVHLCFNHTRCTRVSSYRDWMKQDKFKISFRPPTLYALWVASLLVFSREGDSHPQGSHILYVDYETKIVACF